ncbi:neutral zinc metallopeptidase, partial [Actinotignum timonense]
DQLASAIDAAAAIGDDHIQESAGMDVNPEKFSHGSSAQRMDALTTGYETGDFNACNTWR